MKSVRYSLALLLIAVAGIAVAADQPASPSAPQTPPTRVRGTVQKLDGNMLTVKTREGKTAEIKLADNFGVIGVVKAKRSDIASGKFIGSAAKAQPDGTLQALEVVVFPDNMRGFGEGHYPWDLQPESTMTNATVSDVVKDVKGDVMTVRYKDGEKKIVVPKKAPIVTLVPADKSALKKGAHVFVTAQKQPDGSLGAQRVAVGLKGVVPPM
ncbi:MAG: hypothetical protein ACJ8KA_07860 [Sulfurifustis sp.]